MIVVWRLIPSSLTTSGTLDAKRALFGALYNRTFTQIKNEPIRMRNTLKNPIADIIIGHNGRPSLPRLFVKTTHKIKFERYATNRSLDIDSKLAFLIFFI